MVFVYKKLAQFAVRCALPPRRSESPICATDNRPSCVLHLLGWFIGSCGFSSLERRPECWVLHSGVDFSVYPHMAEGAKELYGVSLRALIPFKRVPSSWLHLLKARSNTITLAIRNSTCEFWGAGCPKHSEDSNGYILMPWPTFPLWLAHVHNENQPTDLYR